MAHDTDDPLSSERAKAEKQGPDKDKRVRGVGKWEIQGDESKGGGRQDHKRRMGMREVEATTMAQNRHIHI